MASVRSQRIKFESLVLDQDSFRTVHLKHSSLVVLPRSPRHHLILMPSQLQSKKKVKFLGILSLERFWIYWSFLKTFNVSENIDRFLKKNFDDFWMLSTCEFLQRVFFDFERFRIFSLDLWTFFTDSNVFSEILLRIHHPFSHISNKSQ